MVPVVAQYWHHQLIVLLVPTAAYCPPLVEVPGVNHHGRLPPSMVHLIPQFYPYLAPTQGKVI